MFISVQLIIYFWIPTQREHTLDVLLTEGGTCTCAVYLFGYCVFWLNTVYLVNGQLPLTGQLPVRYRPLAIYHTWNRIVQVSMKELMLFIIN